MKIRNLKGAMCAFALSLLSSLSVFAQLEISPDSLEKLMSALVVNEVTESYTPEEMRILPLKRLIDEYTPESVIKQQNLRYKNTVPWLDSEGKKEIGKIMVCESPLDNYTYGIFIEDVDKFFGARMKMNVDPITGDETLNTSTWNQNQRFFWKYCNDEYSAVADGKSLILYSPYSPGGKVPTNGISNGYGSPYYVLYHFIIDWYYDRIGKQSFQYDWDEYRNNPKKFAMWFYMPEYGAVKPYYNNMVPDSCAFNGKLSGFVPYDEFAIKRDFPVINKIVAKYIKPTDNRRRYCLSQFVSIVNNDGSKTDIEVHIDNKIKSVSKDKNIVTIALNEQDTLRYSTFARAPFAMKFKNSDVSIDYNRQTEKCDITVLKEFTIKPEYDGHSLGEVPVPVGSKLGVGMLNLWSEIPYSFLKNSPSEFSGIGDILREISEIYNNGEKVFWCNSNRVWYWKDGANMLARSKAKEAQERKAAELPIYNAYCNKYGKRYVDAIMNDKLLVGTPISLIKEVLSCNMKTQSSSAQFYNVIIESPLYDFENKKLVPRKYHDIFSTRATILVVNGRVSSIANH